MDVDVFSPCTGIPYTEYHHVGLVDRDDPLYAIEHTQQVGSVQVQDISTPVSRKSSISQHITLKDRQDLLNTGLRYHCCRSDKPPPSLNLSKIDILRWRLASSRFLSFNHVAFPSIAQRARNYSAPDDLTTTNKWLAWLVLLLASIVYGGLHALAWDVTFSSLAEQILWRLSAITVMGYGFVVAGFWRVAKLGANLSLDELIRRLFHISSSIWSIEVKIVFGRAQRELWGILNFELKGISIQRTS
ncbi:hypothetical protein BKA61DRAFT_154053 [Leptodontidium sp. MPI-SDFR-AT-0119]|nr:hypothetical protein BKA61DRAFT_154053 [Leptodontidium sp. MPI-SDFR-AT-0119]